MNRVSYIFLVIGVVMSMACAKESVPSKDTSDDILKPVTIHFEGGAIQSKVSVGDFDGDSYPGLWEEGDALDVYRSSDNAKLGTVTLDPDCIGMNSGSFTFETTIAEGTEVYLVYPAGVNESSFAIPSEQSVVYGDKSLSSKTIARSETVAVSTSTPVHFTLSHSPAIVKVNVSSSEFVGYQLKKVQLYSKGNKIAGTVSNGTSFDVINATPTTQENIGDTGKELWFTAVPGSLSSIYVVVYMEKASSGVVSKATIPFYFKNVQLQAGTVNEIPLVADAANNSCKSWYNHFEKRELLSSVTGAGYAYGTANTVFVEKKKQAGYTSTVEIDVRASGEFTKVSKPFSAEMLISGAGRGRSDSFSLESCDVVNGRITVKAASGANYKSKDTWGSVAIKDASGNILWSFMVQGYFDEDAVVDVDYGEFKMMDRPLGSTFSGRWMASHKDSGDGIAYDTNSAYFQWGRKDPFPLKSNPSCTVTASMITSSIDVSYGIKNPTVGYMNNQKSWTYDNVNFNLWGTSGHKTVFDPCPKGYKVPQDAKVRTYVNSKLTRDTEHNNMAVYNFSVPVSNGETDYWTYNGLLWGNYAGTGTSWASSTKDSNGSNSNILTLLTNSIAYGYWTNACSAGQGGCIYWSGTTSFDKQNTTQVMSVRCQRDTENL